LARRGAELEEELSEAKKKVQSLEMKLLDLTQRMAEMEGNHVQRMREKQEELDQCKVGGRRVGRVRMSECSRECASKLVHVGWGAGYRTSIVQSLK